LIPAVLLDRVRTKLGLPSRPSLDLAGLNKIYAAYSGHVPNDNIQKRIWLAGDKSRPVTGGWRPDITLVGLENLKAALERGHGAILWVSYTHGAKLLAKMAVCQAGYAVSHLSRPRHGLSSTKFGIRWLNRVQTTIENRYIDERIVVNDGEFQKAVRSLMTKLRANKVISITVHRDALRPTAVPFLKSEIVLADGACKLSHRTNAALLPVFAFRDENGAPNVQIGAPIEPGVGLNEDEAVSVAHREYAARLEKFVLAQWRGWYQLL
jgi:lauroyl/myristoyl acyltransferase